MAKKTEAEGRRWLWILSYPGSGRTKLKLMLGAYAHKTMGEPLENALISCKRLGISFSHSIARDPVFPYFVLKRGDGLVASAQKQRVRDGLPAISDEEQARLIAETWAEFEAWPAPGMVITYEALVENPAAILVAVLAYAPRVKTIDTDAVAFAVEFSSLENMRKLEDSNFFKSQAMQPVNGVRKVRR